MPGMMVRPRHKIITGEFSIMYGAVLKGWLVGRGCLCYLGKPLGIAKCENNINEFFFESQNFLVKYMFILI